MSARRAVRAGGRHAWRVAHTCSDWAGSARRCRGGCSPAYTAVSGLDRAEGTACCASTLLGPSYAIISWPNPRSCETRTWTRDALEILSISRRGEPTGMRHTSAFCRFARECILGTPTLVEGCLRLGGPLGGARPALEFTLRALHAASSFLHAHFPTGQSSQMRGSKLETDLKPELDASFRMSNSARLNPVPRALGGPRAHAA